MRTLPVLAGSLVLLVVGCGGAAPPPEAPAAEAPANEGPADEAAEAPKAEGEGSAEKAASGAPASDDDVNAILQLVVDDPELDSHLHLGTAGRFPLQVSGEKLPSNLKLVKSTEPVKVVEPPKSKKDAVLVFTEIDIQGDKATVRYRYDVEGIRGTVTLSKSAHGWELKNSRLVEH